MAKVVEHDARCCDAHYLISLVTVLSRIGTSLVLRSRSDEIYIHFSCLLAIGTVITDFIDLREVLGPTLNFPSVVNPRSG